MHGNIFDKIGAKNAVPIARRLPPGRIIGEACDHANLVSARREKPAQPAVERSNACHFGPIVDPPQDDSHRARRCLRPWPLTFPRPRHMMPPLTSTRGLL